MPRTDETSDVARACGGGKEVRKEAERAKKKAAAEAASLAASATLDLQRSPRALLLAENGGGGNGHGTRKPGDQCV